MKEKITLEMFVEDLLGDYSEANRFFLERGMRCLKCGEPYWGSLAEFLKENGVENMDEFVEELKKAVGDQD